MRRNNRRPVLPHVNGEVPAKRGIGHFNRLMPLRTVPMITELEKQGKFTTHDLKKHLDEKYKIKGENDT